MGFQWPFCSCASKKGRDWAGKKKKASLSISTSLPVYRTHGALDQDEDDKEYLYTTIQQKAIHKVIYLSKQMVPFPKKVHNVKRKTHKRQQTLEKMPHQCVMRILWWYFLFRVIKTGVLFHQRHNSHVLKRWWISPYQKPHTLGTCVAKTMNCPLLSKQMPSYTFPKYTHSFPFCSAFNHYPFCCTSQSPPLSSSCNSYSLKHVAGRESLNPFVPLLPNIFEFVQVCCMQDMGCLYIEIM